MEDSVKEEVEIPMRITYYETAAVLLDYCERCDIKTMAEIGVFFGDTARYLLERYDFVRYTMIDNWKQGNFNLERYSQEAMNILYRFAYQKTCGFNNARIIRENSISASRFFEDRSIDMVFLDASHDTDDVVQDIEVWWPKVGKIMIGHDYDWDSVKKAVEISSLQIEEINYEKGSMWIAERKNNDS